MSAEALRRAVKAASRQVDRHPRRSPKQVLKDLAAWCPEDAVADRYGAGGPVAAIEARVAERLGKEAAVFMPSGTMAQPIALRIWCDRKARTHVAFHACCHLEVHEHAGYQHLHRLTATKLGSLTAPMSAGEIAGVPDPLGAVLIELPQRDLGGVLPTWDELTAQVEAARAVGAAAHLDGARLWECGPAYGRPLDEIAGLFDSVYVSFYKTLGGVSGAALAGPADFIRAARVWLRRQGGNLVQLFPSALSALRAWEVHLPRVPRYVDAARHLAEEMGTHPRVRLRPGTPQVNMFQAYFEGERDELLAGFARATEAHDLAFVTHLAATEVPGWWRYEVTAGEATLTLQDGEVPGWLGTAFGESEGP